MKCLNSKIKVLAMEAQSGSRYLLFSDDFPDYCLQIECGDTEDYPQNELLLIDKVITFNTFRECTKKELADGIREKLINRLSKDSVKKIEEIFSPSDRFYKEYYNWLTNELKNTQPILDISTWPSFKIDFSSLDKKSNYRKIDNEIGIKNGFYAIFINEKCLYVGIGKNVAARIKSHYKSALGEEKERRWSEFFQLTRKEVTIFSIHSIFSKDCKIDVKVKLFIEAFLDRKYLPAFEYYYNKKTKTYSEFTS